MVQIPDQRDFTINTEITPIKSASGRVGLNVDPDRKHDIHFGKKISRTATFRY